MKYVKYSCQEIFHGGRPLDMKIKENDGLPQRVCMRCLGTLEFLCDFYDRCHHTQKELLDASQCTENKDLQESDVESNKENTLPATPEVKHKVKTLSDAPKVIKSGLSVNNGTNDYTNKQSMDALHLASQNTIPLKNFVLKKSLPLVDNLIVPQKELDNDENNDRTLMYEKTILAKEEIGKKPVVCTGRSGTMKDKVNLMAKSTSGVDSNSINLENPPPRRKRGRKSKLELLREAAMKKEIDKDVDNKKLDDIAHRIKRKCLRPICTNSKVDTANVTVISCKPQKEQQFIPTPKVCVETRLNEVQTAKSRNDSSKEVDMSVEKLETAPGNKPVSVIVKQEKLENEDTQSLQSSKSNQFVWIPNELLIHEPEKPKPQKGKEITHTSPPPGDEAEENKISDNGSSTMHSNTASGPEIPITGVHKDVTSTTFSEQNRVTVIKSSQNNMVIEREETENYLRALEIVPGVMDQSTGNNLFSDFAERPLSQRSSRDSSFSGNRSKDGTFGKISELITDEQKETIETYYKVDMSIVNSEEVQKHLTVVDKKNIKCNICGILYLRMDKCQVHIWGHLKMKPYQCKACDFATVTVSNVRCHIRKSHLKIKPFACHLCEKRYVTAVLLEEHLNTHTGARPFKCKICDFASASRQMLSYHNTTHKPVKDISCKSCGKEFYSRGRLRAHMLIHNKDKVVMCKLCSAYLSNAEALETHHKNIHMRDYICNVCGKRVKSRKALHNHQNVHAAAKYKCTLCSNVYKSSQILKEHILKHKGIRKYKCTVCEKAFAQQSHLAAHMAVHSKIRFHCPGCNKAFNRHDNMKIHTKRCKVFLANPELKNLLTRKEKTKSVNTLSALLPIDDQLEDTTIKTVNDTEKTDANVRELEVDTSCVEPTEDDLSWNHHSVQTPTVIEIVSEKVDDSFIPGEFENLTVLQNVLAPESF